MSSVFSMYFFLLHISLKPQAPHRWFVQLQSSAGCCRLSRILAGCSWGLRWCRAGLGQKLQWRWRMLSEPQRRDPSRRACQRRRVHPVGDFQFVRTLSFMLCSWALMMRIHPSTSLLGKFTNTNCQGFYRRWVHVEPHPFGSISGFVVTGSSEDVLSHGRGEVRRCWSDLGRRFNEFYCQLWMWNNAFNDCMLDLHRHHFNWGRFVPRNRLFSCGDRIWGRCGCVCVSAPGTLGTGGYRTRWWPGSSPWAVWRWAPCGPDSHPQTDAKTCEGGGGGGERGCRAEKGGGGGGWRVEGEGCERVENKREEREGRGWGSVRRRGGDNEGGGGDENRSSGNWIISHIQDNISGVGLFTHVFIFTTLQLSVFLLDSEMHIKCFSQNKYWIQGTIRYWIWELFSSLIEYLHIHNILII